MVRTAFVVFLLSTKSHAQSGPVIPLADAGHASQASCVILKRMGRIDRTKSRLYALGMSGKQFRYVEGKLPEGFSLHGKMTDHDVRNLQARGAQVLVLDSHYSTEDLREARANCPAQTSKTLSQAEAKASPAPAPIASTPTLAPKPLTAKPLDAKSPASKAEDSAFSVRTAETAGNAPSPAIKTPTPKAPAADTPAPKKNDTASSFGNTEAALLDVSSTPTEADIYIDERLSGHTPSTLILMPGDHTLVIKKDGFVVWKRKFNLPSGRSNVDANLVSKAK